MPRSGVRNARALSARGDGSGVHPLAGQFLGTRSIGAGAVRAAAADGM
jgi:hypothetical protein